MNAKRDENRVATLLTVLNTDGTTIQPVCVNMVNNRLCVDDATTGSDYSILNAPRDENRVAVAMAVSSEDGITPVELYSDNLYNLLVQST